MTGLIFAFVCAPIGLVCSAIALMQIKNSGGRLLGHGYAVAGIAISLMMMLFYLFGPVA